MNNLLPRKYGFRNEIFPVAVVGILLNLVAHYLVSKQTNGVFADMGGTALVAILLGPWWAATVGILSGAITGSFYSSYFPFGLVQVMGGLTWGYLARSRWIRAALFPKDGPGYSRNLMYSYLVLFVSGGIVCGLVSSIIKLVLYPRMGLPLHSNQAYYLNVLQFVKSTGLTVSPDAVALLTADVLRDLADKALVVLLALLFVQFMGFIPDRLSRNIELPPGASRLEPLKTDAVSILAFAFTYAIYLLMARLLRPEINIQKAPQSIYWLRDPLVLVLLYAPIILAILAFLLLSYGPNSVTGRRMDAERRKRASLYNLLIAPSGFSSGALAESEVFLLLKSDGVYGLLITVLFWPTKELAMGGPVNSILIYFGVMAIFAGVFFYQRREFSGNFCRAHAWLTTLHKWLVLPTQSSGSEPVLRMFAQIFKDHLQVSETGVQRHGPISYLPAIVTSKEGYLHELSRDMSRERLLLILPDRPGNITGEVHENIHALLKSTQIEVAIILTLSPLLFDESAVAWLKMEDQTGKDILLLGPEDIEYAIYENAKVGTSEFALVRGRMHVLDSLIRANNEARLTIEQGVEPLVSRALPYLEHVLATLSQGSLILDLGAGRGRHTIAALKLGHSVVAIERNRKCFEDLESFVSQLGDVDGRFDRRCEHYMDTRAESVGLVDLVIITGVLQHTSDADNLRQHLRHLQSFASAPSSMVFIEMLFDMTFDGQPPGDGRFDWTQPVFEQILHEEFPATVWSIELVRGPLRRDQSFADGPRSFLAPAQNIGSTAVEYLISREA